MFELIVDDDVKIIVYFLYFVCLVIVGVLCLMFGGLLGVMILCIVVGYCLECCCVW